MNSPTQRPPFAQGLRCISIDAECAAPSHIPASPIDASRRASTPSSEAIDQGREQFAQQVTRGKQFAAQQYDRTANWVAANPFSALGAGFATGMLLTYMFGPSGRS